MKPQSPTRLPFDINLIVDAFNIQRQADCKHLQDWLTISYELDTIRTSIIEELYQNSKDFVDYWNEEELKMQMISLLFFVANIVEHKKIAIFYERKLSSTINDHLLSVNCDCMVATSSGIIAPKAPYFFLQEFKKGKGEKVDPEAQMLIAMLIAQHQNKDGKPIYGSYVIGRHWYFTTLLGNQYCQANPFDATIKKDLYQIVYVLRALKDLILSRL